ncbi:MAG: diguanylate cyclase [Aquabacterium sp.]|nr:diguanylate cyclase [Aquabacterium sp.]
MSQQQASKKPASPDDLDDVAVGNVTQQGLSRFYLTLPAYVAVITLLWVGALIGSVRPGAAQIISGLAASIAVVIYTLLRSGFMAKTRDPMLAFTHAILSIVMVSVAYALLDDLRSTALLWLSVIVVFDMWRLPQSQVRVAVACCIVMPLMATGARHWLHPMQLNWLHEVFTLLMLAVVLPVLFTVSAKARAVKARHLQQKQTMVSTLTQMQELAIRDGLTGLFDRRHMMGLLENERRLWLASKQPFSVAILDLDHFKRINDQYGHGVGDVVLKVFSKLAQATFPQQSDMLARWGGEEFLLVQSGARQGDMLASLGALREVVGMHNWAQYADGLHVSFSAGVCQQQDDLSLLEMIELADQALYQAKAAGRDRAVGQQMLQSDGSAENAKRFASAYAKVVATSLPMVAVTPIRDDGKDTEPGAKPHQTEPAWLKALFGAHTQLRAAQYMCLLGAAVYGAAIFGVLLYMQPMGLLSQNQALYFVIHALIGAVLPIVLLRSGVTADWQDPAFAVAQIVWGGTAVIAVYGMAPSISPSTLQMMCLGLVFGFSGLNPREAMFVGRYYVALLLGVLLARFLLDPVGFNPRREILEVIITCLAFWMLTLQSHKLSLNRERVRAEKRELTLATDKLNKVMRHDPLTKLFNRQYMQSLLAKECAKQAKTGVPFSVALIDLDHFKSVNDEHGHGVGDEVLKGFARVASTKLRDSDVLARWGGEEFLVLLIGSDPAVKGMSAMNRLREAVQEARLSTAKPSLVVTFSAGLSEHILGESITKTLQRADEALYEAKAQGRNRCMLSQSAP